ncbi:hypothetical protein ABBQ38_007666 [Trebouxia sp. C0009 RCD-2024]
MAAQQAHKRQRKERRALDAAREAKVELIAAARHFQKELDEVKTFQREAAEKAAAAASALLELGKQRAPSGAWSLSKEGMDGCTRGTSSDLEPASSLGVAPTSGILESNQGIPEHDEATPGSDQGNLGSRQGIPEGFEGSPECHEAVPGSNEGNPAAEQQAAQEDVVAALLAKGSRMLGESARRQAAAEEAAKRQAAAVEAVTRQVAAEEAAKREAAGEEAAKRQAAAEEAAKKQAAAEETSRARAAAQEAVNAQTAAGEVAAEDVTGPGARFAACIQQLMRLAQRAAEPGLAAASAFLALPLPNSPAHSATAMDLAHRNLASVLTLVDQQEQLGNLVLAIELLSLALALAQLVGLPQQQQAAWLKRRALLCKSNLQPFAAFINNLHASQLSPGSEASLDVVAQLGHWGFFPLLRCFVRDIRAVLAAHGSPLPPDFARLVTECRRVACLAKWMALRPVLVGNERRARVTALDLLDDLGRLIAASPHNQAFACKKAQQEMHLGRFGDALSTMDAFLGRNGMQASCWAVHLFVHIQWLNGGLDQMVEGLQLLMTLRKGPLEDSVAYVVPGHDSLERLLHQVAGVQGNWAAFDRLLQQGDCLAAGQVLADVENTASGVFSPALRARQLCLWACLRRQEVQCVAVVGSSESAERCLQALCACEWARALAPSIWRQAIPIQEWVYQFLGAGPVAFLYGQVANQQDASLQERALYRLLHVTAQNSPFCPDGTLDPARPIVNPAQFLGVAFTTDEDVVNSAHNRHARLCLDWRRTATGFVNELDGVGSLCGPKNLQAEERLEGATNTVEKVHFACDLLTFDHMRRQAAAWFRRKYDAELCIPA